MKTTTTTIQPIWKPTFCLQKHQRCSIIKDVLKNFTKFRKTLVSESLSEKVY